MKIGHRLTQTIAAVFIVCICLIGIHPGAFALSAQEIQSIITQSDNPSLTTDANAAVLFRSVTVEITDPLHKTTTSEVLLKILTGRGKHEYGDLKIRYNTNYDTVDVPVAETYTAGGDVLPLMEGADNTIVPPELLDAAVYDTVKERVISFSGVEPGAVLHWKTVVKTAYPAGERFVWGDRLFRDTIPIFRDHFTLVYPAVGKIHFKCLNGLEEPAVEKAGKMVSLHWNRRLVPMISTEWSMSDIRSFAPRLVYSTVDTWEETARWFRSCFRDKDPKHCDELQNLTDEIIAGKNYTWTRIDAIYRWVADNVRTIYLPLGLRDYHPNDPKTVQKNLYGDALDKTNLLLCLLRHAGFQAEPVVFQTSRFNIPPDIPGMMDFNAIGVVVRENDDSDWIWLDPAEKNCRTEYFYKGQGTTALIVGDTFYRLTHVPSWPHNVSKSRQELTLKLDPDGSLTGSFRWTATGYYDIAARRYMRGRPPGERRMRLDRMLNTEEFPAEILDLKECDWSDLSENVYIEAELNIPKMAIVEGNIMIVTIPDQLLGFAHLFFPTGQADRKYPVELRTTGVEIARLTLEIPKGYRVIYAPESFQGDSENDHLLQEVKVKRRQVRLERTWTWKKRDLSPEAFKNVKKGFDVFHRLNNVVLLLEKKD